MTVPRSKNNLKVMLWIYRVILVVAIVLVTGSTNSPKKLIYDVDKNKETYAIIEGIKYPHMDQTVPLQEAPSVRQPRGVYSSQESQMLRTLNRVSPSLRSAVLEHFNIKEELATQLLSVNLVLKNRGGNKQTNTEFILKKTMKPLSFKAKKFKEIKSWYPKVLKLETMLDSRFMELKYGFPRVTVREYLPAAIRIHDGTMDLADDVLYDCKNLPLRIRCAIADCQVVPCDWSLMHNIYRRSKLKFLPKL